MPRVCSLLVGRHLALEARCVMHVFGRGIDRGPLLDDRRQIAVIIDVVAGDRQVEHVAVAIDAATRRSRPAR